MRNGCNGKSVRRGAMAAAFSLTAAAVPAYAETVAFVDRAYVIEHDRLKPAGNWFEVAHVEHEGRRVVYPTRRHDLQPGDLVVVDRVDYVVFVHKLGDNTLVPVRAGTPWQARRQSIAALSAAALAWIEDQLSGVDQSRITSNGLATLGTRGGIGTAACYNERATDQPTGFAMPIFSAPQSAIAAGRDELVVPWTGGAVPFRVRLIDAASGTTIAEQANLSGGCAARLRMARLLPGSYRVAVVDARGAVLEESHLLVGEAPPAMPEPLKSAALPDVDRRLYYASWLSSVDEGKWAFEALQQVVAMDCRNPAVRGWLSRWGEFSSCGG